MRGLIISTIALTCISNSVIASPNAKFVKTDGDRLSATDSTATISATKWRFFFCKSLVLITDNNCLQVAKKCTNEMHNENDCENHITSTTITKHRNSLEAIKQAPSDAKKKKAPDAKKTQKSHDKDSDNIEEIFKDIHPNDAPKHRRDIEDRSPSEEKIAEAVEDIKDD